MLRTIITLCTTLAIAVATACGETPNTVPTPAATPTFDQAARIANKSATFEKLYRNNEAYQGKQVYLKGRVVQVIADGNSDRYELRVAITQATRKSSTAYNINAPALERYEDPVYVHYRGPVRLLEGDIVEILGTVKGLITYETVNGLSVTIPEITDARLQLIN